MHRSVLLALAMATALLLLPSGAVFAQQPQVDPLEEIELTSSFIPEDAPPPHEELVYHAVIRNPNTITVRFEMVISPALGSGWSEQIPTVNLGTISPSTQPPGAHVWRGVLLPFETAEYELPLVSGEAGSMTYVRTRLQTLREGS